MAVKISELEELAVAAAEDDVVEIVDTSESESKKISVANLVTSNPAVTANTAHAAGDGSDHADVATNTSDIATNVTAIGLNTTHRGSSGVDHSNVVLNDTLRTTGWTADSDTWVYVSPTSFKIVGKDLSLIHI